MNDLNAWGLDQATDEQRTQEAQQLVDAVLDRVRQPLIDAVIETNRPAHADGVRNRTVGARARAGKATAGRSPQCVRARPTGRTAKGRLV